MLPITRMQIRPILPAAIWLLAMLFVLGACSPKFNWREVRPQDGHFVIMLPAKPDTFSREVNIGGNLVAMTMTAAEIDGVTFAIGSAVLPDAGTAAIALTAMKTALVRNINGTIAREAASAAHSSAIEVEAVETLPPNHTRQPRLLIAHFIAKGTRVYQLVVVGPEQKLSREAADTFFASFKPG